jgi:hypothetical protein
MAFNIQDWVKQNSKDEVLFLYNGEVSNSFLADSLGTIEAQLEKAPSKARKKIFNVLVEAMQNLYHHSSVLPPDSSEELKGKYAVCILSKNCVGYHVITGNFVNEKQKTFLDNHLSHINNLDKEELKNLYKEILDNQEFSEKGGGGLGMVDIARKSGSKIKFEFHNYSENYYFFSINVNIVE